MLIQNGKIYKNHNFSYQDLRVEDGKITEFLPTSTQPAKGEKFIDVQGAYVLPGFIDLQVHGAAGCDFSDGCDEAFEDIGKYLLLHGVTGYLAASDSFPQEVLEEAFDAAKSWIRKDREGARLLGIHMTGPFLSPKHSGIQDKRFLLGPDMDLVRDLNERSGRGIRIVDISPELPGAKETIRAIRSEWDCRDIRVALTHSEADFDTARMCYAYGANMLGDLYRDMVPCDPADTGLLGASVDACQYAMLTMDTQRFHPSAIRMAYQLFTEKRICLTGDTTAFAGLRSDTYLIDEHEVTVKGGRATFEDGRYAGGIFCLDDIIRQAANLGGIPLAMVVDSVTETPAKALGIFDEVGSIELGKRADLIVADLHSLEVQHVLLNGKVMF